MRVSRRAFIGAVGATAVTACAPSEPAKGPAAVTSSAPPVAVAATGPVRRFDVRTFGAAGDGAKDDAGAIAEAIKAAIGAGPGAVVFFPKGRYLLAKSSRIEAKTPYPAVQGIGTTALQNNALIALQDVRDVSLVGEEGSFLLARDADAAVIGLSGCRNVTIRSLAMDYEQVQFTQGTVAAVNEAANTVDLEVQRGYPDPTSPLFADARTWFTVRSAATPGVLKAETQNEGQVFFNDLSAIRSIGGGRHRISGVVRGHLGGVAAGDRFVFAGRDNAHPGAVCIWFSQDCVFDRVTIHGAPVLAFSVLHDSGLIFRECVIEPLPGSDRLISTNADGIHCKWNRVGPRLEGCRFSGTNDDSFTIHGTGTRVLRVEGAALIVERLEFFRVGDELAIIESGTGRTRGSAKVVDAGLVRWREQVAVRLVLDAPVSGTVSNEAMYGQAALSPRLDLVTPPERRPDIVADLSALGSGFVVRGCTFARHLGASRVYASNGVIEDNRYEQVSRHGIQVGMELYWPEVFSVRGLVIRRNRFIRIRGETNIRVQDKLGLHTRAGLGLGNRDIEITENTFDGYGAAGAVLVSNAENVRLAGNTFAGGGTPTPVALDLCRSVTIEATQPLSVTTTPSTDTTTLTLKGPVTTVKR